MTIAEFLAVLADKTGGAAVVSGGDHKSRCPAHKDSKPSLTVREGDGGKILLKCHKGCTSAEIVGALGLKLRDLFAGPSPRRDTGAAGGSKIVATYDYVDESGALLFQVVRFDPKDFRQRSPDGDGWTWKTAGVRRVPYRLPEVLAAVKAGKPVYVCEGEKDVDAVRAAGGAATCNPGGAGKWLAEFREWFAGAQVVIVADADDPGRKHAVAVSQNLAPVAKSVAVVECPPRAGRACKDAAEFLGAGGMLVDLLAAADRKEPAGEPDPAGLTASSIGLDGMLRVSFADRLAQVPLYYAAGNGAWYGPTAEGFARVKDSGVSVYLAEKGFSRLIKSSTGNTVCDLATCWLTQNRSVAYAGPVPGYNVGEQRVNGRRILVTDSLRMVTPRAGSWPIIRRLVTTLFADPRHPQADVFFTWLASSFSALHHRMTQPGPHPFRHCPALGVYGPRGCGKTALVDLLVVPILGGHQADPFAYLVEHKFNRDLLSAAALVLDDKGRRIALKDRFALGESIKDLIWKPSQRIEGKGLDAVYAEPFWRVIMAGNDDDSGLQSAPALSPGLEDKIAFLRARQADGLPSTHEENDAWAAAIRHELPAFAAWLLEYRPPESLPLDPRSRVCVFRHPEIVSSLREMQPELKLFELVDLCGLIPDVGQWSGTATEFERDLRAKDTTGTAERLMQGTQAAGRMLSELARLMPDRIVRANYSGVSHYTIRRGVAVGVAAG